MPISFNTGASADSGGAVAASQTLTIPAGVLLNDVVIFVVTGFDGASGAVLSVSSTGTATSFTDQNQTTALAALFSNGGWGWFIASATDAGKVLTFTLSGGTNPFWSASLGAWTGAGSVAPIDVHGGAAFTSAADAAEPTPTLITGVANDWAVQMAALALPGGSSINLPAGTTARQNHVSSSSIATAIVDSNASVGPAGTSIGGGTYNGSVAGNTWYNLFTVGLAPPPPAQSGLVLPGGSTGDRARRANKRWILGL